VHFPILSAGLFGLRFFPHALMVSMPGATDCGFPFFRKDESAFLHLKTPRLLGAACLLFFICSDAGGEIVGEGRVGGGENRRAFGGVFYRPLSGEYGSLLPGALWAGCFFRLAGLKTREGRA